MVHQDFINKLMINHKDGKTVDHEKPFVFMCDGKIDDEDLIEQLYELSRHTELCYIRTSNCIGYPAIVDVSISREYNNQIVSVSLSAKEADAENEFLGGILDEEVSTQ